VEPVCLFNDPVSKDNLVPVHHTIKTYGGWSFNPKTFYFGNGWSCQLHAPVALLTWKSPSYPLYRRSDGPDIRSGRCGEEKKISCSCRESNHDLRAPRYTDWAIPMSLTVDWYDNLWVMNRKSYGSGGGQIDIPSQYLPERIIWMVAEIGTKLLPNTSLQPYRYTILSDQTCWQIVSYLSVYLSFIYKTLCRRMIG
jgi:hypothetical protein